MGTVDRELRRPPTYRPPPKVRDEQVRRPLPGVVVDTLFFVAATAAVAWLAILLVQDAWRHSLVNLLLLVPFWLLMAYLVLPRLHTLLTGIYVPGYFIARTRTSDGLLGDPVNLAVDGTARQIHEAMTRAGWTLADDITLRSSWGIVVSSLFRRSYPEAPVSPLHLFGRRQCLAYQQEVEGNAAQRHHVRLWRCPDGWLLPGGHRAQWLGAGTYDRAVGLSLFTLQVTHKIDADIDVERDYIVASLRWASPEVSVRVVEDFSTGYHHRNGGGDAIRTDGDLPVIDLRAVVVPQTGAGALPPGVVRAAEGYDDPFSEGGVAAADEDRPEAPERERRRLPRPVGIVLGTSLAIASVLVGVVSSLVLPLRLDSTAGDGSDLSAVPTALVVGVVVLTLVVYGAMAVLALLTYQGYARPRVWLMLVTLVGMVNSEAVRIASSRAAPRLTDYLSLGVSVLVLLALTSRDARTWSRRTAMERRARRGGRVAD